LTEKKHSSRAVLITGSSRGIGFAAAAEFLYNGDRVAIFCRHQRHTYEALEKLRGLAPDENVIGLCGDVRVMADVKRIIAETTRAFGGIDVLVNNTGIALWKPVEKTSELEWDDIIETNLKGQFLFIHEILPVMRRRGSGVIINISSGLGSHGLELQSLYLRGPLHSSASRTHR